ncbi:hydrolase [Alteromonadaceae bacterium M269]|nr:hydrolase [Alteromonadaceae bacterium M269]
MGMSNLIANESVMGDTTHLESSHFEEGKYINANPEIKQDMSNLGSILKRYLFEKRVDPTPENVPLEHIDANNLQLDDKNAVYRLGHSSILLKLEGKVWLADPVFSERASFVQWAGPKRFHPVPLDVEQLPEIEGVIISHDHYDHLDEGTIKQLNSRVKNFFVPKGVDAHLKSWGVSEDRVHALDWWESVEVGGVSLTATPAQHFSGRGLFDGNETLWASWVIKTKEHSLFFSGDSGYFDGFKLIGERFGPFDITLMETGAYDRDWADIHMLPEESVQAHIDLKGKVMVPIHNGTFDLALHPWYEPFNRVSEEAKKRSVTLATPVIGEKVSLDHIESNSSWWLNARQFIDKLDDVHAANLSSVAD